MSKGTKQVRLGKLIEMVSNMEKRLDSLNHTRDNLPTNEAFENTRTLLLGQINELELCIDMIKAGYQIETTKEEF